MEEDGGGRLVMSTEERAEVTEQWAAFVRMVRAGRGETMTELAEALGLAVAGGGHTVSQWARGKRLPQGPARILLRQMGEALALEAPPEPPRRYASAAALQALRVDKERARRRRLSDDREVVVEREIDEVIGGGSALPKVSRPSSELEKQAHREDEADADPFDDVAESDL